MKKVNTSERILREYVRQYIKKTINEADDQDAKGDEGSEEAPKDAETKPTEKPAPKQEKPVKKAEPEQEVDTVEEKLQKTTAEFTRKIKEMGGSDYMTTILADIIQSFGMSTEQKVSLLRNLKAEIIK